MLCCFKLNLVVLFPIEGARLLLDVVARLLPPATIFVRDMLVSSSKDLSRTLIWLLKIVYSCCSLALSHSLILGRRLRQLFLILQYYWMTSGFTARRLAALYGR